MAPQKLPPSFIPDEPTTFEPDEPEPKIESEFEELTGVGFMPRFKESIEVKPGESLSLPEESPKFPELKGVNMWPLAGEPSPELEKPRGLYEHIFESPKLLDKLVEKGTEHLMHPGLTTPRNPLLSAEQQATLNHMQGEALRFVGKQMSPANILTLGHGKILTPLARIIGSIQMGKGATEIAQGQYGQGAADLFFGGLNWLPGPSGKTADSTMLPNIRGEATERLGLGIDDPNIPIVPHLGPRDVPEPDRLSFPSAPKTAKPRYRLNTDGTYTKLDNPTVEKLQASPVERLPVTPGTAAGVMPQANAVDDWWNTITSRSRPKRTGNVDVTTLDNPIAKLIVKLRQSRILEKEQRKLYTIERGKRAGNIENIEEDISGEEWLGRAKEALAGKYSKVRFEPLDLTGDEFTSLINGIRTSDLDVFGKTRAGMAIEKIMRGQVPQRNEIKTLSSVFTNKLTRDLGDPAMAEDITAQLIHELYAKKPFISKTAGGMQDLQRTLMSSMDMSAPFRQGITGVYNKEWWTSWDDMFKAWGSENAAKAIDDSIKAMPDYKLMKGRLSLSDVARGGIKEEGFGSQFAEKYVPFVRRSERAYSAFLNKFRADLFATMMKDARKSGMPEDQMADYVAGHINAITGRASLGKMEKHLDALNNVFYAPRLMASRVKMLEMLTPMYYVDQPAVVRKQALKSVLSTASVIGTVNALGLAVGGKLEADPRSSNAGKVKFGDTRIDPGGGELQYITALARIMSQSSKDDKGRIHKFKGNRSGSTYDTLLRFLENKVAPDVGLMLKGMKGVDPGGNKYNMPKELAKTFTPMILQDLADIIDSDPDFFDVSGPKDSRALAAAPLTFFGMGSQTY